MNAYLVAFFAYFGLIAGLIIMRASKEEQKAAKKYFLITKDLILVLMVLTLLFYNFNISSMLVCLLIVLLRLINLKESYYMYPVFGFIFYFSLTNLELLLIESFLIFVYGLIAASVLIDFKNKDWLGMSSKILLQHISFIGISFLLMF